MLRILRFFLWDYFLDLLPEKMVKIFGPVL